MKIMDEIRVAMEPLRERWEGYSAQEQLILSVLGVVTLLVVLIFGIWLPSHKAAEQARQQYQNNQALLGWIQANAGRVHANAGPGADSSGSVLTVVNNSAAASGLALRRFEPDGEKVRIWLEGVNFNTVASWLNQLSQQGVNAIDAEVERQADTGLVSVRLTLSR